MTWGVSLTGVETINSGLEELTMQWDDETLYIVAPTVSYAVYQERGTSTIEARPYMRPAAERVQADAGAMLQRYQRAAPDAGPVEVLAIAVQNEAKQIADRKGVRDTGALINSITYERVT